MDYIQLLFHSLHLFLDPLLLHLERHFKIWHLITFHYTSTRLYRVYIFTAVCLCVWLGPYWNWWHLVEDQGHSDAISIFPLQFSISFPTVDLFFLYVRWKWNLVCCLYAYMPSVDSYFIFIKFEWKMMSLWRHQKVSPYHCPHLNFYLTHKLCTWYQHTST